MAQSTAGAIAPVATPVGKRTPLNRQQIIGFWAAWFGWMLDGMDSVIYALVLGPALTELLPRSGIEATPANIGYVGSLMFGLFLVGWGLSFIWGPISDRFGRTKSLAATILVYALFTGAAAFSTNVWMLAIFRFLAGIGVGGEWAMAGTYVAEAWPEDRRKMGAGYLQTGYYFGFFVAAVLNYTIGATFGWRAMFLCGLFPVVVSIVTLLGVKEPERWEHKHREVQAAPAKKRNPFAVIFSPRYLGRTITMSALLTIAIVGLWAGAVYEPTAIVFLSRQAGMELPDAAKMASYGTALLSIGTILGCIAAPWLAERLGRRPTLALYYLGMMVTIAAGLWLGILSADWHGVAGIHGDTVLPRHVRRQFRDLQPVAAGAIRHRSARNRLRLLHLGRPLHRRRSEFWPRRCRRRHGHARHACRSHRDRIRRWASGDSLCARDSRADPARLKPERT